jgi:inorganic triphosphatase YgiF
MPNGAESELKFLFAPEALAPLRTALRQNGAGSATRKRLVSHYFDTANDYLWRRGVTLRIRKDGDESTQTVKREKPSALERDEFETTTEGDAPDLAAIEDASLARLFKKAKVRKGLRSSLDVEVERETTTVMLDGGEIETALDIGETRSNGLALQFSELELELKKRSRDALFELARALCAGAPITLNLVSKAERGHLLAAGDWGRAFKGRVPQLKKRMNCAEALPACMIFFSTFRRWLTRMLWTTNRGKALYCRSFRACCRCSQFDHRSREGAAAHPNSTADFRSPRRATPA